MENEAICLPNFNEDLAEFFGILTGDGYVNQYNYPKRKMSVIEITGNKEKDFDYIKNYVCSLIERLFCLTPKIYLREDQNAIRVIIYSRTVFNFIKERGFPLGNKGEIKVSEEIMKREILFKRFIRGFFDTDGCLCLKKKEGKRYPSIGLSSKSKSLLLLMQEFLKSLGITSYIGKRLKENSKVDYKLDVNGKTNVLLFFKEIGSSNLRNLAKYDELRRMGLPGVEPGTT
jgi:intein/homing endonuclease